ncbi:helix-turn-helix transcriptional regulator [Achromobacter sp. ESBL13]|uniref:helix-turn-helix transcriptional regulator n=1 Tax=Achromobacter sp. ESBL13 TaxID=3077328 RepID=UPI002FCA1C76
MTQSVPHAAPVAPRHHSPGLAAQDRFLRMHQVCEMCGLSRSAIYGRIKLGLFAAQVQLGPKSVAWLAYPGSPKQSPWVMKARPTGRFRLF